MLPDMHILQVSTDRCPDKGRTRQQCTNAERLHVYGDCLDSEVDGCY